MRKSASDWQCLYLPLFFKSFGGPGEGFGEGPDLMWGHGPDLMWGHPPDALGPFNPSRHLIVVSPQALCLASVAGQGKPVRGKLHLISGPHIPLEAGQGSTANTTTLQPGGACPHGSGCGGGRPPERCPPPSEHGASSCVIFPGSCEETEELVPELLKSHPPTQRASSRKQGGGVVG